MTILWDYYLLSLLQIARFPTIIIAGILMLITHLPKAHALLLKALLIGGRSNVNVLKLIK